MNVINFSMQQMARMDVNDLTSLIEDANSLIKSIKSCIAWREAVLEASHYDKGDMDIWLFECVEYDELGSTALEIWDLAHSPQIDDLLNIWF